MNARIVMFSMALMLALAGSASAQPLKLEFVNGLVNLSAQNVPVRTILAEWARLGGTTIVNGDRVAGGPVTIEVQGKPERYVLDLVLRDVAGYMIAARQEPGRGASRFDRVMILPTSTAPKTTPASTTATFAQPPRPRQLPDDIDDVDDVDDDALDITTLRQRDQEAVRRAEELARQRLLDQQNRVTGQPVIGGEVTGPTIRQGAPFLVPGQTPQQTPQPPPPSMPGTISRPSNPFNTLPGTSRPGEVTPAPPAENRGPNVPEQ